MSTGLLVGVLAGLLVVALAVLGFRAYVRWFFRQTVLGESPSFQVTVTASGEGRTRAEIRLRGTGEPMEVTSLRAARSRAEAVGLKAPEGFEAFDEPSDEEGESLWWRPVEALEVQPGEPLELELAFDPDARELAAVFGQAERRVGLGGVGTGFTILVGPRPPLEVEASNLRSELYARAREEGVVPRDLPEWVQLEALEARVRRVGSSGDEERP